MFGGDLYDRVTKKITVDPVETDGWINIACVDSATYKMHKVGHTSAAQFRLGIQTTLEQRRAMLNAWTANVCGTGTAFTEQGEKITLVEQLGVFRGVTPFNQRPTSYEAIWDEHGAVCLDVPRRYEDESGLLVRIQAECGGTLPPPCDTRLPTWRAHGHVLTGNLPP